MKAILRKYAGETLVSKEIVQLPEEYDGDPYGDTVPFVMHSNWSLSVIEEDEDPVLLTIHDVISDIRSTLLQMDGEDIAEVYNETCLDKIRYEGDSLWSYKEESYD